jgi:secreted trypsin-like serine protease
MILLLKASQICLLLLTLQTSTTDSTLDFPHSRALIFDGTPIDYNRQPYFSYLYFLGEFDSYGCGGSLIAPDIVLTAAQCLEGFYEENRTATAWVNISIGSVNSFDYKAEVQEVMVHPEFSFSGLYNNDIAIVKLSKSMLGIPLIQINNFKATPVKLDVIGYGSVAEELKANHIMSATVYEVPFEECNSDILFAGNINKSSMLCAGSIETANGGKGVICDRDIGGPLLLKGIDASHDIQYGIASIHVGCGTKTLPDVYVRLSNYAPWIQENVCLMTKVRPCPKVIAASSSPTMPPTFGTSQPKPSKSPNKQSIQKPSKKPSKKPLTKKPTMKPTIMRITKTPTLRKPTKKPTE